MGRRMRWAAAVATIAVPIVIVAQGGGSDRALQRLLENAQAELAGVVVPALEAFSVGDREVAADSVVNGPVAVRGTLRIAGTVNGDVFSYGGDIVVLDGARVTGSAIAIDGRVRSEGGDVLGEMRAVTGAAEQAAPPPPEGTAHNVALTLGWAAVVLLVGIGVLVFGGRTLDAVGEVVDQQFGRAFVVGIGTTLAIAPALAIGLVALALTVIGVLLIPFAIVAYVLAVVGLVALGFLAAVRVTGQSLSGARGRRAASPRGAAVAALVFGTAFYLGLWLVAAVLTPFPAASTAARVIAFAITWAAATVGLGATVISRAGSRSEVRSAPPDASPRGARAAAPAAAEPLRPAVSQWETPTPVSGVVAARRPATGKPS